MTFASMGIPESEIKPRENVFTFKGSETARQERPARRQDGWAVTFVPVNGKAEPGTVTA